MERIWVCLYSKNGRRWTFNDVSGLKKNLWCSIIHAFRSFIMEAFIDKSSINRQKPVLKMIKQTVSSAKVILFPFYGCFADKWIFSGAKWTFLVRNVVPTNLRTQTLPVCCTSRAWKRQLKVKNDIIDVDMFTFRPFFNPFPLRWKKLLRLPLFTTTTNQHQGSNLFFHSFPFTHLSVIWLHCNYWTCHFHHNHMSNNTDHNLNFNINFD